MKFKHMQACHSVDKQDWSG